MRVIVAGYSKTGTKSMAIALKELGYDVYDMLEHFWYHEKEWRRILGDGGNVDDFKKMYQNVDAVLDVPAFCFWEQIHEAFPDAKIILTTRDEEAWFKSWERQTRVINQDVVFKLMRTISPSGRRFSQHMKAYCPVGYGYALGQPWETISINEMVLKMKFRHHYNYVIKNASKDKLLVYNVKEGWEPLCKFLGKDIPNKSFPFENADGQVIGLFLKTNPIMQRIFVETVVSGCIIVFFTLLLSYFLYNLQHV